MSRERICRPRVRSAHFRRDGQIVAEPEALALPILDRQATIPHRPALTPLCIFTDELGYIRLVQTVRSVQDAIDSTSHRPESDTSRTLQDLPHFVSLGLLNSPSSGLCRVASSSVSYSPQ